MSAAGSITHWIGELKTGDALAAQKLWETYFTRMVALARQRLDSAPRRAADEEDVALSAFYAVCTGARAGRFAQLVDRDDLWSLLVAITAHKCVNLVRHETRQKRGGARELPAFEELLSQEPSPEFTAEVADQLERLLTLLDATGDTDLRPIALGKMRGETAAELSDRLGCSKRSVERKFQVIVRVWEREGEA